MSNKYKLVLLTVITILFAGASALAQGPEPQVALNGCDHVFIEVDESTAGPLNPNDQYQVAYLSHCPNTNELVLTIGSFYGGNDNHNIGQDGTYVVESTEGQAIHSDSFEGFAVPEQDGALTIPIRWTLPLDGQKYRVEVSSILCDVDAGECASEQEFAWFIWANTGSVTVEKRGEYLVNTLFYRKSETGEILDSRSVTQLDIRVVNGEKVAIITFDDVIVSRGKTSETNIIEEDTSVLPDGVQVEYPADARHTVVIRATQQDHTVEFINVDNRHWLPLIMTPGELPACPHIFHQSGSRPIDGGISVGIGPDRALRFWVENRRKDDGQWQWNVATVKVMEHLEGEAPRELLHENVSCGGSTCESSPIMGTPEDPRPRAGSQLVTTFQLYPDSIGSNCEKVVYVDPPLTVEMIRENLDGTVVFMVSADSEAAGRQIVVQWGEESYEVEIGDDGIAVVEFSQQHDNEPLARFKDR